MCQVYSTLSLKLLEINLNLTYNTRNYMKSRIVAFFTHLIISGVVAAMAVYVVFFNWYPAPLHTAVGVTKIFLMLLAIDIIIGPVITFIVYKTGKKTLKFDLTVIALLQLVALGYGMNTVFEGRPAFVVFNVDRFDVSRAHAIDPASAEKAEKIGNESAKISVLQPKWVAAVGSKDAKRRQEILFTSVQGGADWPQLPELFVPLAQVKAQVLVKAKPLQELRKLRGDDPSSLEALASWKDNEVKWLPLRGIKKDMVVLVDASSATVIEVLDINPWP